MTSQDNLKMIIQSMPHDTPEITHVILKSQVNKKQYHSLGRNGNNSGAVAYTHRTLPTTAYG